MTDNRSASGALTREEWREVSTRFAALLETAPAARARELEALRVDSPRVASELRSLLDAHDVADDRFDAPALARFVDWAQREADVVDALISDPHVGPYTIVRRIGEGGMGAVYEAERTDVEFRKRVAIKTIARGVSSAHVAARFRRERQILAELQHPNIATLFDGGVTPGGVPYFVMELVEGVPIDAWCAAHRTPIRERLDLVQQICLAVQHAHQRFVVHRDLKPQNVLVESSGLVKLLDFGVARLLERDAIDGEESTSTITRDSGSPLTVAYASPEQLRGEAVTVASDVYSLGVMLYELLSGVPPVPRDGVSATQLSHQILQSAPKPPSQVCTETAAQAAGLETRDRLAQHLRGELDAIVMKAMHAEPSRRYQSADALGDDIRRYLRGQPVGARGDSLAYRTSKFVRRHRAWVIVAGASVLLAATAGASLWWQSRLARRETARAARIADFLQGVLGASDATSIGGSVPRLGPTASFGMLLDSAVKSVSSEFDDDAAVRARLYLTVGSSYAAQGRLREAAFWLDSAVALSRASYGDGANPTVMALLEGAAVATHRNREHDATAMLNDAMSTLQERRDTAGEMYARALKDRASLRLVNADYAGARDDATSALRIESARSRAPTLTTAVALNRLAAIAAIEEQLAKADTLSQRSIAELRRIGASNNVEMLDALFNAAFLQRALGRGSLADSLVAEGLSLARRTFGDNSREFAIMLVADADRLLAARDPMGARRQAERAVRLIDSVPEVVTQVRAVARGSLALTYVGQRDWVGADSMLRHAIALFDEGSRSATLAQLLLLHGSVLTNRGAVSAADSALTRLAKLTDHHALTMTTLLLTAHTERARVRARLGDTAGVTREMSSFTPAQRAAVRAYLANELAMLRRPPRASR